MATRSSRLQQDRAEERPAALSTLPASCGFLLATSAGIDKFTPRSDVHRTAQTSSQNRSHPPKTQANTKYACAEIRTRTTTNHCIVCVTACVCVCACETSVRRHFQARRARLVEIRGTALSSVPASRVFGPSPALRSTVLLCALMRRTLRAQSLVVLSVQLSPISFSMMRAVTYATVAAQPARTGFERAP